MPAPAQPSLDALDAALHDMAQTLAAIKAENQALKQQLAAGVLTDDQVAKIKSFTDAVNALGKSQGP